MPLQVRRIFATLCLVVLVLSAAACASATATPQSTTVPELSPTAASGYPSPGEVVSSYPGPDSSGYIAPGNEITYPTATIMPDLGQVRGVVLRAGQPLVNITMYVSPVIVSEDGTNVAVKLDRSSLLNAVTDTNGAFFIPNVPPGKYGLVLDAIVNTLLLSNPDSQEQIVIEVKGADQIDLGTMDFDELPIP